MRQDGLEGSAGEILGKAEIVRSFYEKKNIAPLWDQLYARVTEDPTDYAAFMDLSIILHCMGEVENSRQCQLAALEVCRTFKIKNGSGNGPTVLVFVTAGDFMTNTPIEFLLEKTDVNILLHYVDEHTTSLENIGIFDFAFVGISEYGNSEATLQNLNRLLGNWPGPVMNRRVEQITALSRDGLHATFKNDPTIISPLTVRAARQSVTALAAGEIELTAILPHGVYPIIVRPFGTHAGEGMEKISQPAELADFLKNHGDPEFYVTQFVDYSGSDGLFRKQRIAFIDGKAYASHMAISDHWMVHYLNADMEWRPERRAEEAQWMQTFDEDFAHRHAVSFDSLRRRIGLDYFVIDCAELPDGRLLLFEADVAMIVHAMDSKELFPYKEGAMDKLFSGFARAMNQRVLHAKHESDVICAHTSLPAIFKRTENDCLVCCIAMFTGRSYEEVEKIASQCDPTYPLGGPMSHSIMRGIANAFHVAMFSSIYMFWEKPAIIGVISPTQPNTGHALFWDGQKVIDPSGCQHVDRGYVDRCALEFTQEARDVATIVSLPQMKKHVQPAFSAMEF